MKKFHFCLIVLTLFACQSKPDFRIIPLPTNHYPDFPRLVAGSEKWLVYPNGRNILLFSSLDFAEPDDSIYVEDEVWDHCVREWEKDLLEAGEVFSSLERPAGIVAERFPDIKVQGISIVSDTLLFCVVKLNYLKKLAQVEGPWAIYPLLCYNLKTKDIEWSLCKVNTYRYFSGNHVQKIFSHFPPIVSCNNEWNYVAHKFYFDSVSNSLKCENIIDLVNIKSGSILQLFKANSNPLVYTHNLNALMLGVGNQIYKLDCVEGTVDSSKYALREGKEIYDFVETKYGRYFLVFEKRSEFYVEVYKGDFEELIYSAPLESTSTNFQYWNGHYYFFYDQDAVTYAIEFD